MGGNLTVNEVSKVKTGAKGTSFTRHQNNSDFQIIIHLGSRRQHILRPITSHGIQDFRAVQSDFSYRTSLFDLYSRHDIPT
jgi:hypothetical protein